MDAAEEGNEHNDAEKHGEDDNFDEEYDKVRDQAGGVVTLIEETRETLNGQLGLLRDRTLIDMFKQRDDLDAVRATAKRAKRVLRGSGRFLVDDVTNSLQGLRASLAEYSQTIVDKLKEECPSTEGVKHTGGASSSAAGKGQAVRQAERAHAEFARIAAELKELEMYVAEIEETVNQTSSAIDGEANRAEAVDRELENASGSKQETDEERRAREEEELREAEEKERIAREKEEERKRKEEEEQRRREEEQRRRDEEEARRLEEEERLRKEDPRHWPAHTYELSEDEDQLGTGVGCVVRSSPESTPLDKNQLQCTAVDRIRCRYPVGENEEIVSTMVCLKPYNGVDMDFQSTVWVAIPFAMVPRGRETIIRVQSARSKRPTLDPAEKCDDEKTPDDVETPADDPAPEPAEWNDVMTRDTNVEGQENTRFVETPVKQLYGSGINIIVVTRPRRDAEHWNNKGGRLVSSIDPRVWIAAPKNAFRLGTDISLQVILIDSSTLSSLKERYDGCDMLLGTSPLVCVTASSKPQKPFIFSVTHPSGGFKKPKTVAGSAAEGGKTSAAAGGTAATEGGGISLPKAGAGARPMIGGMRQADEIEDVVHLLVKDSIGKWRHRDNVKLEHQRDCIMFQLNELVQKLILFRTQPSVASADLTRVAGWLETSLVERPAQLVVRQREDDPSAIFVELCRRDAIERLLNSERLRTLGYTEGPEPGRLVCLREGDLVEISFRDNIEPIVVDENGTANPDEATHRFLFNSSISSINFQQTVRERSAFAQNALDVYRGYVRLSLVERSYVPPPKVAGPSGISAAAAAANIGGAPGAGAAKKPAAPVVATGKPQPAAVDPNLVCEIQLTLPKPPKELTRIKRVGFTISPNGPLTSEYYDQLSEFLGDEWMQIAEGLGLGQPAIQRIVQANVHHENPADRVRQSAREALIQWHRSSTKFDSGSKVDELKQALINAGRNDLAEELNIKNKEYRREIDKKREDERLKKSVKVFVDSVAAVRCWREVGHELGLTPEELEAIGGPAPDPRKSQTKSKTVVVDGRSPQVRGYAEKMLNKWIEHNGEYTSVEQLIAALKKRKLNDIAASLMVIK